MHICISDQESIEVVNFIPTTMTFTEFINLNPKNPSERDLIITVHLSYLNDLTQQNFPQSGIVQLRSYCEVFIEAITNKTSVS